MKYPSHDKRRFYKYVTASTAKRILESGNVRYSSPKLFNDPFDVQSGLHFDFDLDSLPDRILERMRSLVDSDAEPGVDPTDTFGQAVLLLRKHRERGFPAALQNLIRPTLSEWPNHLRILQRDYQSIWWENFLPRLRVFCVTEENDNLLMWSHYAKDHTGAVLEFSVLPEIDNALCAAGAVQYRDSPIPLFTVDQWLDDFSALKRIDSNELYWQYAYVKSSIWAYEKEWRVWTLLDQAEDRLFTDYPMKAGELSGAYLGCKLLPSDRDAISTLMRERFPNARLYSATKALNSFSLVFTPLLADGNG